VHISDLSLTEWLYMIRGSMYGLRRWLERRALVSECTPKADKEEGSMYEAGHTVVDIGLLETVCSSLVSHSCYITLRIFWQFIRNENSSEIRAENSGWKLFKNVYIKMFVLLLSKWRRCTLDMFCVCSLLSVCLSVWFNTSDCLYLTVCISVCMY